MIEQEAPDARARILQAASDLVAAGGIAALTTRAVAAAASVQAPTLYRLFGDKRGLLDAVAEHGLAAFVREKEQEPRDPDPVQDLRAAWDRYIAFGLDNPAVFAIMSEVGRTTPPSPATLAGLAVLRERVGLIARAGRLRVPEERAIALIHAAGVGMVTTLLATPLDRRDPELGRLALDAVLGALVSVDVEPRPAASASLAIGLRAHLGEATALSPGERLLMRELLDRIAG
jgi:AcrR family transcriptional regulator